MARILDRRGADRTQIMANWKPTVGSRFRALIKGTAYGESVRFKDRWRAFAVWPPNVFALASILLEDSGGYRIAVSPHDGRTWPPDDPNGDWSDRVCAVAEAWRQSVGRGDVPPRVLELGARLAAKRNLPLKELTAPEHWDCCAAVLELLAIADEACIGVGIPSRNHSTQFPIRAEMRLGRYGTLARLSPNVVRVLPKLRTSQAGISVGSLSHHVTAQRSEVRPIWHLAEGLCDPRSMRVNLLVVPWPYVVEANAFREAPSRLRNMDPAKFGFFDFKPAEALNIKQLGNVIDEARRRCEVVDGVVLPEGAIEAHEIDAVQKCLEDRAVPMLVAGVRGDNANYAHLALFYEKKWRLSDQHKHHRWSLDGNQIRQYHLGSSLHPERRWWENIAVRQRELNFVTANGWLTTCHLICEDLARQEPVADLVRAVGPNLVIALLLDGPQLSGRWPARYASVLADDPGSSVLTVTSLGMSLRSWDAQHPRSRVVALWKDARRGLQEISLEREHQALLLTIAAHWTQEWTADGRSDNTSAAELVLSGVEQIAEPQAAVETAGSRSPTQAPAPRSAPPGHRSSRASRRRA
ncbi:MAG: hypothetical protein KF819_08230 [Labilithrix sp.]|nr:hypothetical protein [Labilithrix sp.]